MTNSLFKQKLSPIKPGDPIDYKDVETLKKFITENLKTISDIPKKLYLFLSQCSLSNLLMAR